MPKLLLLASGPIPPSSMDDARASALKLVSELGKGDVLLMRRDAFVEESKRKGFVRVVFDIDAGRFENGQLVGSWYTLDDIPPKEMISWPNYRDRQLVIAASKAVKAGWDASALIIYDGQKSTENVAIEHLVKICKEFGVPGKLVIPSIQAPAVTASPVEDEALWTERDLIWTDTETTGLSHNQYYVIQIGCVHTDPSARKVRREFEIKLKIPDGHIPDPIALQVNGYSEERWKDAVEPIDGMKKWIEWLPKKFIHANQHAVFDRNHLFTMCQRYGLTEPGWGNGKFDVCTKKMANGWFATRGEIKNAKLETICDFLGIDNTNSHDALVDARRARLAYIGMIDKRSGAGEEMTGTDD